MKSAPFEFRYLFDDGKFASLNGISTVIDGSFPSRHFICRKTLFFADK